MAKIHAVLQGKGGVGKSFVASLIAQYKADKGQSPLCVDTDPVNNTFAQYEALKAKHLDIMEKEEINTRRFDDLIEMIAPQENDVVIDNGASTFVPLSHYLISNDVPALLSEMGHELVIHTVIAGSQSLTDTVSGFMHLAKQFPTETTFVVWINPYWGPVEYEGKPFEKMKAYLDNKDRISAVIKLPKLKEETFGKDLSEVLEKRITFDEALTDEKLTIMTRQRLKTVRRDLFSLMDTAAVL